MVTFRGKKSCFWSFFILMWTRPNVFIVLSWYCLKLWGMALCKNLMQWNLEFIKVKYLDKTLFLVVFILLLTASCFYMIELVLHRNMYNGHMQKRNGAEFWFFFPTSQISAKNSLFLTNPGMVADLSSTDGLFFFAFWSMFLCVGNSGKVTVWCMGCKSLLSNMKGCSCHYEIV